MASNFTIISTIPHIEQMDVPLDAIVQVVTSVQIYQLSLTPENMKVRDSDNNVVTGDLSYSNHKNNTYGIITFTPDSRLKPIEEYTIELSTLLLGINGETLGETTFIVFNTGVLTAKTLTTPDNIKFTEFICWPSGTSNIETISIHSAGMLSSTYRERSDIVELPPPPPPIEPLPEYYRVSFAFSTIATKNSHNVTQGGAQSWVSSTSGGSWPTILNDSGYIPPNPDPSMTYWTKLIHPGDTLTVTSTPNPGTFQGGFYIDGILFLNNGDLGAPFSQTFTVNKNTVWSIYWVD